MNKDRLSIYKSTLDDWYPNYSDNQVCLTYHGDISYNNLPTCHRVSVWGKDDLGMNRDFKCEMSARLMFVYLSGLSYISQSHLSKLGFNYF